MHFCRRQAGFTIIELLIYMGLLMIFLMVLLGLFSSIISATLESKATSFVEQDSRFLFSRLSYDLKRASDIVLPANLGDSGNTLELTIDGDTHTYALSNNNLGVSDGVDTYQLNSTFTQITDINFQRIGNPNGNNTIVVDVTIESSTIKSSGDREIKQLHTTIGTR